MRDGFDAYVRPDGRAADYAFMAYCENQALVYEALVIAARELFPEDVQAKHWLSLADEMRRRAIDQLWCGTFFAAAIDKNGPIETASSAVFEMLNGPFFENLKDGPEYVEAIVMRLYHPDFMTAIGPRMISLEHSHLEGDYYAYQGSGAVWGVTDGIVATGLHHWSLGGAARDLGLGRLVGWFNRAEQAMELTYVHRQSGRPLYKSTVLDSLAARADQHGIFPSELGQRDQAWSASAALRQLHTDYRAAMPRSGTWQSALNRKVMRLAREIPTPRGDALDSPLYVNLAAGRELKRRRAESLGISA
jgi:glycogen debranching enzyme